jgi:hypothetical protein
MAIVSRMSPPCIAFCVMVGCGRFSPGDSAGGTGLAGDTSPDSGGQPESGPPHSGPVDSRWETGSTDSPIDTWEPEPIGVSFDCGEWETGTAPQGMMRVRDADLTINYNLDVYPPSVVPAIAADSNGDGCSEIMVATLEHTWSLWLLPGTVADSIIIEERGIAIILGDDEPDECDHHLSRAAIGDLNGDGARDEWLAGATAVGCPDDLFTGAVYSYSSPLQGEYSEADAEAEIPSHQSWTSIMSVEAGDLDGDGDDDVAIGGTASAGDYVRLMVFSSPLARYSNESDAIATVAGEAALGFYTSMDSDVNADGLMDLAVSNHNADGYNGAVYVFAGPVAGSLTAADADWPILGEDVGSMRTGFGLAGGADANLDGYDDLLIAASNPEGVGKVYLVLGSHGLDATLADSGATFVGGGSIGRESVSLAQDIDADGFPDPAFGSPMTRAHSDDPGGAGYLFYGPVTGVHAAENADAIFYEDDSDWHFGWLGGFVTGMDTDGDGYDDLLMGNAGRGPAHVFRGGPR